MFKGGGCVALKAGRNAVCVSDEEETCTAIFTELSELSDSNGL